MPRGVAYLSHAINSLDAYANIKPDSIDAAAPDAVNPPVIKEENS